MEEKSSTNNPQCFSQNIERYEGYDAQLCFPNKWCRRPLISACVVAFLSVLLGSPQDKRRTKSSDSPHSRETNSPLWHVGVSKLDITPDIPIWLSGFASRSREPTREEATASAQSLFVRSISIRGRDKDGAPLVLVALDLIGADGNFTDSVFRQLHEELQLDRPYVRLCFSHTHSGPVVGKNLFPLAPEDSEHLKKVAAYQAFLRRRIVECVSKAVSVQNTVLADARYAVVPNIMAVNRRETSENKFDGTRRGETDDRLSILWFEMEGDSSQVVGGIYGLAAHASVITAGYEYSGDYPGVASMKLEASTGLEGVWLFTAGAGGDQNIYPRGDAAAASRVGSALADQIAVAVRTKRGQALKSCAGSSYRSVAAAHEFVALPFRNMLSRRTLGAISRRSSSEPTVKRMAVHWLRILDARTTLNASNETPASYSRFPIAVWRIGELRIAFLGGEPTVGYSLKIREMSSIGWVVGYTDDVMGYVGTTDVLSDGSREGSDRAAIYYGLPSSWDRKIEPLLLSACANLAARHV